MHFADLLMGFATGVPVMIVVGPVALLLMEQGIRHGFTGGLPAAAGVATTDLTFSAVASLMGAGAVGLLGPGPAAHGRHGRDRHPGQLVHARWCVGAIGDPGVHTPAS